jgi:hypothetical protein
MEPVPSQLFRPLERRPEARTITVRELLERVRRGEVRIPEFQRPLRWSGAQVRELLDSIRRGYPVGSLLFWKRKAEADPDLRLGGARISVPAVVDAWWVVDGQQRITALAASLLDLHHGSDSRWVHAYDPEQQQFVAGEPAPGREHIDVPVRVLGDLSRLGRWLRQHAVDDTSLIEEIENTQRALLDYAIPLYLVETEHEEALRGVFARLNSTGSRMRADEVFHALLGSRQGDPAKIDLPQLQQLLRDVEFGNVPRTEVLKAVLAMSDLDPTRRSDTLNSEEHRKLFDMDQAAAALEATVRFLQETARIPLYRLLPYPVVFVILAKFFHVFGDRFSDPVEDRQVPIDLRRWLWRGVLTAVHQRAAVSELRTQVRAIRKERSVQQVLDDLLERVRLDGDASPPWKLSRFDQRAAASRVEMLTLLSLEPRNLTRPISPQDVATDARIAREVFPVGQFPNEPKDAKVLAASVANRVLLQEEHSGLSRWFRKLGSWQKHEVLLQSHLIDETAFKALLDNDPVGFVRHRGKAVQSLVQRFLHERAEPDAPRIRPLDWYMKVAEGRPGDE